MLEWDWLQGKGALEHCHSAVHSSVAEPLQVGCTPELVVGAWYVAPGVH